MKSPDFDGIVLDLETVRGPDEVGGWAYPERFGLAVAVTWDARDGFREWFEGDVRALAEELLRFDHVVGFNLLDFDYKVLAAYQPNIRALLSGKTVDILAHVYQALGFRVSLDNLARVTLGRGKTSAGDQAIRWWKQGKRDLVVSYCRADVELTRDLYLHGVAHGVIYYPSYGGKREMKVSWRGRQELESPSEDHL
jgi:DEAD/DEAH box helicase domain-containing protein